MHVGCTFSVVGHLTFTWSLARTENKHRNDEELDSYRGISGNIDTGHKEFSAMLNEVATLYSVLSIMASCK